MADFVVQVPKFDQKSYLETVPSAEPAIASGQCADAFDHFLRYGIDSSGYPLLRRESLPVAGAVERLLVSQSGYCLIFGWVADEGNDALKCRLIGADFSVDILENCVLRHARNDVEQHVRSGAYDYGFCVFGKCASKSLLKQPLLFTASGTVGSFQTRISPEVIADKRLLDTLLEFVAAMDAHAGRDAVQHAFFSGPASQFAVELFQTHVANSVEGNYVQRFRPRQVAHSFVTVLFGSTEAIMMQPVLFKSVDVDFGEWIYVCNSPEDAEAVLRKARLMSDLYDIMITVIIMNDNAGFGAANNAAVDLAAAEKILVVNPDVYPLKASPTDLTEFLGKDWGSTLWGGLLFYDEHNLMHSGIYLEEDVLVRRNCLNRISDSDGGVGYRSLLRTEHFEKGVPFDIDRWQKTRSVPAVTGAVMAFERSFFKKLGGFSTRYIYGHYEDADLSLRWREAIGDVAIHPLLRLVHLEGQGSMPRGLQYRGAAMLNRHLFTFQHLASYREAPSQFQVSAQCE